MTVHDVSAGESFGPVRSPGTGRPELGNGSSSLQEPVGDLMGKCSRHAVGGHDIPSAIKTPDHR
ncbi:hypothetical protein [Streptosporangium sp. NPDC000509]|uniref:hypothetical protein n=1 Tax=Streptosporangium sp. NPDC000509 TaxID=3366186 RepID=UPI0036C7534A